MAVARSLKSANILVTFAPDGTVSNATVSFAVQAVDDVALTKNGVSPIRLSERQRADLWTAVQAAIGPVT